MSSCLRLAVNWLVRVVCRIRCLIKVLTFRARRSLVSAHRHAGGYPKRDESPKILFLGGLSGSGKSSFSSECLAGRHDWLHIEIDLPNDGKNFRDGINENGLRAPWDAFTLKHAPWDVSTLNPVYPCPRPLYEELWRRAGTYSHFVLSFSSCQVFEIEQVEAAKGYFCFAYLYGDPNRCFQEYVRRCRTTGIPSKARDLWDWHNSPVFKKFEEGCDPERFIQVFKGGVRRSHDDIYADVLGLIGDSARGSSS